MSDGEAQLLRELSEGVRPRPFALYELVRVRGEVVDAEVCVWGLDVSAQCSPDGRGPGAVFVGPGGMMGNADSGESTLEMFSLIRDVRLVWL